MTIEPSTRSRRSAIYLAASSARGLDKVRSLPCDVAILDLEDSVQPDAKLQARAAAVDAIREGRFGDREVVIRVNGLGTPWGQDDMAAAALAKPDAVLVPKISSPAELVAARATLGDAIPIWAMIETCAAIFRLHEVGAASRAANVPVWVIGTNDLAKEMRCAQTAERPGLLTALSMSVMAARAFGLVILDGIFSDVSNPDGLAVQSAQAAALGFDGKTVIHPNQLEITNKAFMALGAHPISATYGTSENSGG